MLNKVTHSPDFAHMGTDEALADIKARIRKYEEVYETVRDDEGPYIKLYNLSTKVLVNHCYGRTTRTVVPYLMGVHIGTRPIWLVRAGLGEENPQSPMSPQASLRKLSLSGAGQNFAVSLSKFVAEHSERHWQTNQHHLQFEEQELVKVFTSTMPRAAHSAQHVAGSHVQFSALNALDKGTIGVGWWDVECASDVPPWEEVERRHPEFWERFREDPLRCRFPGGESYMDVVNRLETLLIEVEMSTMPVLIVSHITVIQLLIAYFRGVPLGEAYRIPVVRNNVFEAMPSLGGGYICSEHSLHVADSPTAGAGADWRAHSAKTTKSASFAMEADLDVTVVAA